MTSRMCKDISWYEKPNILPQQGHYVERRPAKKFP